MVGLRRGKNPLYYTFIEEYVRRSVKRAVRKKPCILVIDDDRVARNYISKAINENYDVILAVDGTEGIEKAQEHQPDIILLDVEMPGINGFETCDKLKQIEKTQEIPVIFLSSRSSLRERMLGYEVGAVDYFVKPFNKEELLAKFEVIKQYQERHEILFNKYKDASKTAMVAMKGTGEMGYILNFVEKSYQIDSYAELAHLISQTLAGFGLNVCFLMRTERKDIFFSSSGEIKPLEKELITMLSDDHRFHDFGKRTQVNYPRISLLVKNMPLNDMEKYGRYKDLLAPLLTASETKITIIDAHRTLYDQTKDLAQSLQIVKQTLDDISNGICANQQKSANILKAMFNILEENIPKMGLEEDQEDYIIKLVDDSIDEVNHLQDEGIEHINSFRLILSAIETLTSKQTKLIEDVFIKEESVRHMTSAEYDIEDIGVDLF